MGAYLSQPKTDKLSTDERNKFLAVGASSMQGWRNNQEDAHNAILVYDENTSFFAVYDGHGGAEVAAYCADKLPDFLKNLEAYKNADFEKALKAAFLGFDKTLLETDVVNILKELAGENRDGEAEESEDDADEDLAELHEESNLSLKEVLKRYGDKLDHQFKVLVKSYNEGEENAENAENNVEDDDDDDDDEDVSAAEKPNMPNLKRVKDAQKPQSPFLRGRRAAAVIAESVNKKVLDPESQPAGSSTSAAAAAATAAASDGPSSSRTAAKIETDEDAVVSSTNNLQKNIKNNHVELAGKVEAEAEPKSSKTNGEEAVPDSSRIVKENEQNGSVTSSENTTAVAVEVAVAGGNKAQVSTSACKAKKEQQNGGAQRISASSSSSAASSSKLAKVKPTENSILMDDYSTDDDADYDETTHSEDDDEDDEDADVDGDDEADDDDDDDEDELDDDDDEEGMQVDDAETIEANEQFCANMIEEPGQDSGCTAVVALLHGRDLYVANAGDSRCVVSRNGKAIEMSFDHKPEDPEENARILKAGGRVSVDGRVNGGLNLSRAIGDHAYKLNASLPAEEQMISALPDVRKLIITPEDEFMVLACDGIWNYMSSSEVVEFVRKRLDPNDPEQPMSKICEELFDNCLAPNTMGDGTGCDNMTAVIVRFQPSMQELNSKLNEDEVEPKVQEREKEKADSAQSSDVNTMKRIASSSLDDQKQQSKRLKTDKEEENSSSATSSLITSSTNTSKQSSQSGAEAAASSSSNASSTISTSEACTTVDNQATVSANECDSGLPDSSEVSAGPS